MVLVMVEVSTVDDPGTGTEEPVTPPAVLLPGTELPPEYEAEADGLPLAGIEVDPAGTALLDEAELDTAPVLEPAGTPPLDDGCKEPEAG